MPVFILSTYLSGLLALDTLPTLIAAFVAIIFLKQWSSGVDLVSRLDRAQREVGKGQIEGKHKKPRDLHGTVILIVGGFTAQGLLVCAQLSSLGAQLILLTPTIRSSYIMQMIHLLRDGTSNPLIYAEQCDVTNLQIIEAFAAQWNLGEGTGSQIGGLGAGPAGGLSGSTRLGAASSGPGAATKGDGSKGGFAPRHVDSIVFLPLDSARYSVGSPIRRSNEGLETSLAELLGRFHLVNVLLPSLLLLPPNRDIRIVSLLSPWYAAGAASLSEKHDISQIIDGIKKGSMASPWTNDGSLSIIWLALSRELQRRIQLMTDADQRPRTKLPGIDDEGNVTGKATPTNVNLINVCAGFERGRDVLDYLLPGTGKHSIETEEEWETGEQMNGSGQKTIQNGASDQLKDLVDPRLRNRKGGKSAKADNKTSSERRTASEKLQEQLRTDESISPIPKLMTIIQYSVCILLWPLTWLLCKSPRRAAETVTWATIAPIHLGRTFDANLNASAVVPGELHREGRVVRPTLPNELQPEASVELVWKAVEEKAKSVLSTQRANL